MRFFYFALAALAVTGCSSDQPSTTPANQLVANDFESLAGWVPDSPSLTQEKAHSGRYSVKTDKGIEYSLGYRNSMGKVSAARPTKVRLSAYILTTQPITSAVLTLQVMQSPQDPTSVFTKGFEVAKVAKKPGEWTKLSEVIALPSTITNTNELRLYLWQPNPTGPVYLDDISLDSEP